MSRFADLRNPPERRDEEGAAWDAVRERLASRARKRTRLRRSAAACAALAAAAALVFVLRREPSPVWVGTDLVTDAAGRTVRLADGSEIAVSAHASLHMLDVGERRGLVVAVAHGAATFDVTHVEGRRFVVRAGDVEIRVVGTRFRVEVDEARAVAQVTVERGRVEVDEAGHGQKARVLSAGESWGGPLRRVAAAPIPSAAPDAQDAAARGVASEADAAATAERRDEATRPPRGAPSVRAGGGPARQQALLDAFDAANAARARGDTSAAARGYREVLAGAPDPSMASLAGLELGRLELHRFGNPKAAAGELERSLAADPRSSLREETLALLVEARDRAGDDGACAKARDQYLKEFPAGMRSRDIAGRCKVARPE